jgi:hypothetical protein
LFCLFFVFFATSCQPVHKKHSLTYQVQGVYRQ